jgi:hypothetical protein
MAEAGTWLTYSEAAKATGELPDKLRRMVRDGKLTARTPQESNDRKWRLLIPPHMLREGQAAGQGEGQAEAELQAEALAMLRDELAEARERAAKAEGLAEARAEANTALAAALAKAEALADQLRAEHRAAVAELRAELAEARRPWLAKVIEGLRRKPLP